MVHRMVFSLLLLAATAGHAEPLPRVASINLCTDQLLLSVADPSQILSLSWLAADPAESVLAEEAKRYPLNYGTAEEMLRIAPEVVLGGTFTSPFTRTMLTDLGFTVVTVEPAADIAGIERNLRQVAVEIGRTARAEEVIDAMHARARAIEAGRAPASIGAIVVRPGGFTVGAGTLANELMRLAGLENIAASQGLDVWGSLSLESLVTSRPQLLVFVGYRLEQPSVANEFLSHPLLDRLASTQRSVSVPAAHWSCGMPASLDSAAALAAAASEIGP